MSDTKRQTADRAGQRGVRSAQGPSLKQLYAWLALALVAAIGVALLIVLPFYFRR